VQAHCRAAPEIQSAIALLPTGSRRKQEAPFAGSNRFYRGRVVDVLRTLDAGKHDAVNPGIDLTSLGQQVRPDFTSDHLPWLYELVQGLASDGLASVAEDRTPYDPGEPDPVQALVPAVRIKLP
jgi:A/G-specific adenine glycosylase